MWSPLSNLLLYGKTADVPSAMREGVNVSIGTDWAPSGSANLLGELKVADRVNQTAVGGLPHRRAARRHGDDQPGARRTGSTEFIGSIEVGKYADLMVVAKQPGLTPYRDLIDARPQDVLLVTIRGDPLFGDPRLMDAAGKAGDYEIDRRLRHAEGDRHDRHGKDVYARLRDRSPTSRAKLISRQPEAHPRRRVRRGRAHREGVRRHSARRQLGPAMKTLTYLALARRAASRLHGPRR